MKYLLTVVLIGFLAVSCSKDDDSATQDDDDITNERPLIGEWKLFEAERKSFGTDTIIDYSDDNIVYHFQTDSILRVSGVSNAGHSAGEHSYVFEKDYLGGLPEGSKIWLVKIISLKWTYEYSNGVMALSTAYVDGPTLRFNRK